MTAIDVTLGTSAGSAATTEAAPGWTTHTVILAIAVVGVGALLGGIEGTVVAAVAIWVALRRSIGTVAVTAFAALAVAGLMTSLPTISSGRNFEFGFVAKREVAAITGRIAGILALAAVVAYADVERAGVRAWTSRRRRRPSLRGFKSRNVGWAAADTGLVAAALAVRIQNAPRSLAPGYSDLVVNLRLEAGYVSGSLDRTHPSALHMPLAPVIAAFAPGAPGFPLVVASTLTVLAVIVLARRMFGEGPALLAGAAAAFLPSFWGQQLPEALAALAVTAAVMWAYPPLLTIRRAAAAGACLAAAALSRPEVLLVVPAIVAWPVLTSRRRLAPVLIAVVAVAGFWPWELFVHQRFGGWLPTTSLGTTLKGATAPSTLDGSLVGAFVPQRTPPGQSEKSADQAGRKQALRTLSHNSGKLPALLGARVLRGWDLWAPGGAQGARAARGLSLPGGRRGVFAEMAAFAVGAAGALAARRRWRELFPAFAIPVLFTLVTLVTFGDRGLRAWAAPMVAICVGAVVDALLRRGGPVRLGHGPDSSELPVLTDGRR